MYDVVAYVSNIHRGLRIILTEPTHTLVTYHSDKTDLYNIEDYRTIKDIILNQAFSAF